MNSLPPGPAALSDWLSLVDEQPMEPHLPIIDPHHHLWEGRSGNTSVPFVNTFGARNAMGQYLLEELCADDIESRNKHLLQTASGYNDAFPPFSADCWLRFGDGRRCFKRTYR